MADPRVGERMEVYEDHAGEWRARQVAANNEPVNQSEGYRSKFGAKHAARRSGLPVYVQQDDGTWDLDPAGPSPGHERDDWADDPANEPENQPDGW